MRILLIGRPAASELGERTEEVEEKASESESSTGTRGIRYEVAETLSYQMNGIKEARDERAPTSRHRRKSEKHRSRISDGASHPASPVSLIVSP